MAVLHFNVKLEGEYLAYERGIPGWYGEYLSGVAVQYFHIWEVFLFLIWQAEWGAYSEKVDS